MSFNRGLFSSLRGDWRTPKALYQALDAEFHFDFDAAPPTPEGFDGLVEPWGWRTYVNPPYGPARLLLPLSQLKRAQALIRRFTEQEGLWQDAIPLNIGGHVRIKKIQDSQSLPMLDKEIRQNQPQDSSTLSTIDAPNPRDAFIELSRLLTSNCPNPKRVSQEFYRRLMNHLDLNIYRVDRGALARLARGTSASLMDAYTAFTIDDSSSPSQEQIFHDIIIPVLGGLINWCLQERPIEGIGKWVQKGYSEAQRGKLVVMLLPARTDTRWWHTWVMEAQDIRFIKGRLHFDERGPAPFPSCIVVFSLPPAEARAQA